MFFRKILGGNRIGALQLGTLRVDERGAAPSRERAACTSALLQIARKMCLSNRFIDHRFADDKHTASKYKSFDKEKSLRDRDSRIPCPPSYNRRRTNDTSNRTMYHLDPMNVVTGYTSCGEA